MTVGETMKMIGREWQKLSFDEKAQWDLKAGDERAHQNQEYTEFRRKMDIDENNGDDMQCLAMLEAE